MRTGWAVGRRELLTGLTASAACAGFSVAGAFAQSTSTPPSAAAGAQAGLASLSPSAALAELRGRAGTLLGLPAGPAIASLPAGTAPDDYDAVMPQLVDLLEAIKEGRSRAPQTAQASADTLALDVETVLRRINAAERQPRFTIAAVEKPPYEQLRDAYVRLFDSCVINPDRMSTVRWYINKLMGFKGAYERAGAKVKVPWHFMGIVHSLEGSFSFTAHLHNGDPLTDRTVQVPAGRPLVWNPPTDWDTSAADAMDYEGFANQGDWSLPYTLYRFEAYNGFGNRGKGVNTPYLWSFSNHYSKGKFVKDGVWDPEKVSKQCGAALMLKLLIEQSVVRRT